MVLEGNGKRNFFTKISNPTDLSILTALIIFVSYIGGWVGSKERDPGSGVQGVSKASLEEGVWRRGRWGTQV